VKTNIFLAALPSNDNRAAITQKISACEAKRSPLVRIQWSQMNDLHVTVGFIQGVEEKDIRTIALGMSDVSKNAPFMANVEDVRIYGTAIVLRVEPHHRFLAIHKAMNQKLLDISNQQYHFLMDRRYDAHLTIGRIRNLKVVNPLHKQQLIQQIEAQFQNYSFLIQQAALLRHGPEHSVPIYQTVQQYLLSK
jgi:2'-5' RNA ligase